MLIICFTKGDLSVAKITDLFFHPHDFQGKGQQHFANDDSGVFIKLHARPPSQTLLAKFKRNVETNWTDALEQR
jgi:hypothetical protein